MRDPFQVQLSGAGGQGLMKAGMILAEAAMLDGVNVVEMQSYDREMVLDVSESKVILSQEKMPYPQMTKPDLLLCLSQHAFEEWFPQADFDTVVVLDSSTIKCEAPTGYLIYRFPITETASRLGNKIAANVVALGVINALTNLVTPTSLQTAVSKCVPENSRTLNERALGAGGELVQQFKSHI